MPRPLIELMHILYERWRVATPTDFLLLAGVIVVAGWLFGRLTADG